MNDCRMQDFFPNTTFYMITYKKVIAGWRKKILKQVHMKILEQNMKAKNQQGGYRSQEQKKRKEHTKMQRGN